MIIKYLEKMQYFEMIENEKTLCTTLAGRAQLRDMVWFIVGYVKENRILPNESLRNEIQRSMMVRRSKVDETISALDNLARKRYYEKLCANPFESYSIKII